MKTSLALRNEVQMFNTCARHRSCVQPLVSRDGRKGKNRRHTRAKCVRKGMRRICLAVAERQKAGGGSRVEQVFRKQNKK